MCLINPLLEPPVITRSDKADLQKGRLGVLSSKSLVRPVPVNFLCVFINLGSRASRTLSLPLRPHSFIRTRLRVDYPGSFFPGTLWELSFEDSGLFLYWKCSYMLNTGFAVLFCFPLSGSPTHGCHCFLFSPCYVCPPCVLSFLGAFVTFHLELFSLDAL